MTDHERKRRLAIIEDEESPVHVDNMVGAFGEGAFGEALFGGDQ